MMKLIRKMMISCKVAGELVTKRSFTKLSFRERLRLKLHLKICGACKTFEKQSVLLDQIFETKLSDVSFSKFTVVKNENLKFRIKSSV